MLVKANNVSDREQGKIANFFAIYEGPYRIVKKVGEATYSLNSLTAKERGRFHVCLLKRYTRPEIATRITLQ